MAEFNLECHYETVITSHYVCYRVFSNDQQPTRYKKLKLPRGIKTWSK